MLTAIKQSFPVGTTILFACVLILGAPGEAAADYAAIAYNFDSGSWGYAHTYSTQAEAEERAIEECGSGCEVVVWVRNQCAALAVGDGGYGWGADATKDEAEGRAMKECRGRGTDCAIKVWVCSGT